MLFSSSRLTWLAGAGAVLAGVALTPAHAESVEAYPSKPVRIVVPFGPASPADQAVRRLVPGLEQRLGQAIVVDNKPGAAGIIASKYVAEAPPDGYTLQLGTFSTHVLNVGAFKSLPYDPIGGFTPITRTNAFPNVLVVPAGLGVNSVAELLALAKRASAPLTYGSGGAGTTPHLAAEQLARSRGIELLHIPYNNSATFLNDVLAARVNLAFVGIPIAEPHIRAGTLKALAVASDVRNPLLPDVPTFAEVGVPGMEMSIWVGIFAPKGTPPAIAARLNDAVRDVVQSAEVQQSLRLAGTQPVTDASSGEFLAFLQAETPKWLEVIRTAGVEPQ